MASTALSILPIAQGILNFDDSTLSFEPDTAFLSTTSALGVLGAFSPSLADLVADFASTIDQISGEITITGGVFDANLVLADGSTITGTFDAPATLTELAELAAITDGSFTLQGGILDAVVMTGDESVALESLDVASLASTFVLETINAIDATVPFTNGAFSFETSTPLGPISGTVDVAGGDLNIDLATPVGLLTADVDFGDDAVYPFSAPVPVIGSINGVVDFNAGNIVASLGPAGDVTIPISSISGTLALLDGIASLSAEVPVASGLPLVGNVTVPVSTEIELGPLASEYAAQVVQDLVASGTITDGLLTATVDSPLGVFDTTFDIVDFTNQGANFFAGVDGLISLGEGLLTADLTTPIGDVNNTFNLADVAGLLDVPLGDLV
ncbi:MAG: hypothetical protein HC929_23725 [Leptolyngbyaceae cyanobacterium SM2_5_2]|nr:hypothetical protein [Leptolyngbyaceae cyanobacterium SM2_5_2]